MHAYKEMLVVKVVSVKLKNQPNFDLAEFGLSKMGLLQFGQDRAFFRNKKK